MQKYKANITKKIVEKVESDFILDVNPDASKSLIALLSKIVSNSELSLKLKFVSAAEEKSSVQIAGGIVVEADGDINYFSFLRNVPLKIKIKEPQNVEFIIDDFSWIDNAEFTDELSNLMDDAEISKIVDESTPPPIPEEEDIENDWKKLKKGQKKENDPDLVTSIFNFLNKHYSKISRKDVDKQLEVYAEQNSDYVESFIVQNYYYFNELKKHQNFQQNKNINEHVKKMLRDNRNANLDEKVFTYSELDKIILEFGLPTVVLNVRSGNWVIEDDLEDKDIIKLLSKGVISQSDIESLYVDGGIYGLELEKVISKKKLSIKDVFAYKKMLEDVQISEEFKEKQKSLWMKNNPSSLVHNDDLNLLKSLIESNEINAMSLFDSIISDKNLESIKKSKKLEFLINNYQIRMDQIFKYLTNVELFSEASNEIIVKNEQIIIDNPLVLFKMIQNPLMTDNVKKILEERISKLNNKQEQLKMVDQFKQYSLSQGISNSTEILKILDLADKLYPIANKYDSSISSGMSLQGHTTDLNYDKDGFEVLTTGEISRTLFQLMKLSTSRQLVEYIYANELIPFEFKIQPVLQNPACPLNIISHYVAKQEYLIFILKNPVLPESILETIASNILEINDRDPITQLLLKHPHCSSRLSKNLENGVVKMMSEIRESKDSSFLYKTFLDIYNHPENNKFIFEITKKNQYFLLEACVMNWSAPISLLKYFTELLGYGDDTAQEIVLAHPNLDLTLLSKFISQFPQSEHAFNSFKKNPKWKELSIEVTKSFFESRQSVTKTIPLIIMDTLQKFNNLEELASFLQMDSDSEAFQSLIISFEDLKSVLKKDMFRKYLVIAETTNSIEQLTKLMLEVKHPEFGFFNGMLKISDAERERLIMACKDNPILSK